ncbi:MAG: class I SAM-dependent methyltransferase, partial [Acidobacteriota bacterium]
NHIAKLSLLVGLIPDHRLELYDRLCALCDVQIDRIRSKPFPYETLFFHHALQVLENHWEVDAGPILADSRLQECERAVRERATWCKDSSPFSSIHNADLTLARMVYFVCKVLSPSVVLETGVAYGVTSAFALAALDPTDLAALWSIDLPPLAEKADLAVGSLIPEDLRGRWNLYRGPSKRLLPILLGSLNTVDVFIHDSLHTYRNMRWEFETVWPFLRPGGVLISDDIEGNAAFHEFAQRVGPALSVAVKEESKRSLFGVLVKAR